MTIAINSTTYGQLLAQFQPQPVETSEDYQSARLAILNLLKKGQITPEEKTLIKLLTLLMREYDLHQPRPRSKPNEILAHLIEANDIIAQDLAIKLGDQHILDEIINGSREISAQDAQILADTFKVSPTLFCNNIATIS